MNDDNKVVVRYDRWPHISPGTFSSKWSAAPATRSASGV